MRECVGDNTAGGEIHKFLYPVGGGEDGNRVRCVWNNISI
jgi:hypothetical protein